MREWKSDKDNNSSESGADELETGVETEQQEEAETSNEAEKSRLNKSAEEALKALDELQEAVGRFKESQEEAQKTMEKLKEHQEKESKRRNKWKRWIGRKGKEAKSELKSFLIAMILVQVVIAFMGAVGNLKHQEAKWTLKEFNQAMEAKQVEELQVVMESPIIQVKLKDGSETSIIHPKSDNFVREISEQGVKVTVSKSTMGGVLMGLLVGLPVTVLVVLVGFVLMKSVSTVSTKMFKFMERDDNPVSFDDIAGLTEEKEEVMFAVEQLKNSEKLAELGAKPIKGLMLYGPAGTGKTMLAKAIAGEAGVPFISATGSDFVELYVGMGAFRVRTLWEMAEQNAPCVLFIDEFDAVGSRRDGLGSGGDSERKSTLNALLQKMDGVETSGKVFVVAATNRLEDIDSAMLRPGRFDKKLYIGEPKSKNDRDALVRLYLADKKKVEGLDTEKVSKLMFGMTGAEIANTLNEAVMVSLKKGKDGVIDLEDVDDAVMKTLSSGVATTHQSEQDRERVAIHEAGHAIISSVLGKPVAKVSITSYSNGIGGVTVQDTDINDKIKLKTDTDIRNDIRVLLAGREAEKLMLGDYSVGAQNDLERASVLAYKYGSEFGMGDGLINKAAIVKSLGYGAELVDEERLRQADEKLLKEQKWVQEELNRRKEELNRLKERLLEEETVLDYELV